MLLAVSVELEADETPLLGSLRLMAPILEAPILVAPRLEAPRLVAPPEEEGLLLLLRLSYLAVVTEGELRV